MTRIGLLSDTHSFLHPKIFEHFNACDEIWHAGDIGSAETIYKLRDFKPVRAVFGNIDGYPVRSLYPEKELFFCEDVKVFMTHIGGYPGRYEKSVRELILTEKPDLFICGHSHILKVMYDKRNELLHINPGAAGNSGMHKVITFVRFVIDRKTIKDLEIIELVRGTLKLETEKPGT
jgi:putative phosphoesterase